MTATKVETFGKSEKRTELLHEREELGMCADKLGRCRVFNEIKIANVFGQYTSLLTGISVDFPCDPKTFEEEALKYHARITSAIQGFQNRTLEAVGKDKMWHGAKPPAAGEKVSVRGPISGKPPVAAKKRRPRKKS